LDSNITTFPNAKQQIWKKKEKKKNQMHEPVCPFTKEKNLAILISHNHRHSLSLAGEIQQIKNFVLPDKFPKTQKREEKEKEINTFHGS